MEGSNLNTKMPQLDIKKNKLVYVLLTVGSEDDADLKKKRRKHCKSNLKKKKEELLGGHSTNLQPLIHLTPMAKYFQPPEKPKANSPRAAAIK